MSKNNKRLFNKARHYLVGGVNSPVRAFNYVGGNPLLVARGKAAKVYDYDGKEYIDYVLSWGSLILGHAHPEVTASLKKIIDSGLSFGATNAKEIELAALISRVIPTVEKIRFVNSGTEAVMAAIRLARGYTGRDKIIKFEHSYHGSADYLLASSGSGLATLNIPQSLGVPADFIKHTIIVPYGDSGYLNKVFKKDGRHIAAVIFEPAGGNYGVIPPDTSFLKYLRAVSGKYDSLLIADEVITGFRIHFGSLSQRLGLSPDLICLGKIIGGGLPIGAFGGAQAIMRHLSPQGKVYQASTFAGNPVVMQAGLSTLKALQKLKNDYQRLENMTNELSTAITKEAESAVVPLQVNRFGSMFSLKFKEKADFRKFYKALLRQGAYFAPSEYEASFLSFAHTARDIKQTIKAVKLALSLVAERR